jgi:tetratricopeptide (TPR) repeat protein
MALSEIEKLERRYAENPQGLTFAPLAEVHRKSGDITRAMDLLRPGLELHPDYIPASIVLGRCQLDLSDLPAAEAAFTHVLALDGENVIALKALADISERQHRFDQAERWLRTLLSVDRSNDEARAQLERIESARRDSEAAPPPPAVDVEASAIAPPPEEVPPVESAATASDVPTSDAPAPGRGRPVAATSSNGAGAGVGLVPRGARSRRRDAAAVRRSRDGAHLRQ